MISISRFGSTEPFTWCTFLSPKARTTWSTASTPRIWERNLLPNPSPLLAPSTNHAISTNSTVAGIIFAPFTVARIFSSRSSATLTMPTFGSIVQKGKFAASAAYDFVRALNKVDLPTFGRPTIPIFIEKYFNKWVLRNNPKHFVPNLIANHHQIEMQE